MLLLPHDQAAVPAIPQQGVIEDARRRQRLRRRWTAAAIVLAAGLIGGVAWASGGGATRSRPERAGSAAGAAVTENARLPAFNIRLVPMLDFVGTAGWCEVIEEHGSTGGSACGSLPSHFQPFLQISGSGEARSPQETQVAVTDARVVAILVEGRRVPTTLLPGLPYGLRGARIVTRVGSTLVALDAHGHPLAQVWSQPARQAAVQRWHQPQRPPTGICRLQAGGLPGLNVRGGIVATSIRPFPGRLTGHAFLPCAAGEYELRGGPLKAFVVLDAGQPGSRAADLPSFHAVRGARGMFAGGELTGRRFANAWLIAEQGHTAAERMLLLRHLTATIRIGR
jgi:hypothetical protein